MLLTDLTYEVGRVVFLFSIDSSFSVLIVFSVAVTVARPRPDFLQVLEA